MTDSEFNAIDVRDTRFRLLTGALVRRLNDLRRDPNAVLQSYPEQLKLRFLIDPSPGYLAFQLQDSQLLGAADIERLADALIADWQGAEKEGMPRSDGWTP
jgi:hypothetical protein